MAAGIHKDLFILIDCVDAGSLDQSLLSRCDRLAMTPGAMATFEESGLSYLSFEDLYNHKQFRADNTRLIKAVEEMFASLDTRYAPLLGYPRPFTGNIYWFLVILAEIYYVMTISRQIQRSYRKVYLASVSAHSELFSVKMDFSPARTDVY